MLDNIAAADIVLSADDMRELDAIAPLGTTRGERYPAASLALTDR